MNNLVHPGHGNGGRPVFSIEEELEIFRQVMAREKTKTQIARDKGVHRNTINNICSMIASANPQMQNGQAA